MKVMFLCILSYGSTTFPLFTKANSPNNSFYSETFLDIDLTTRPRLQYLCLKNLDSLPHGFNYLNDDCDEVSKIGSSNDFNETRKFFISNVTYLALEKHFIKISENAIQKKLFDLPFLDDKEETIGNFLTEYYNKRDRIIFANRPSTNQETSTFISANNPTKKEKKKSFDFSIFALVFGTILLVCFSIYKAPTVIFRNSTYRIRAQRKRWLKDLLESGHIEQKDYIFLLREVDELTVWVRANKFSHLDLPSEGVDPDLMVALTRRKRRGSSFLDFELNNNFD